MQKDKNKKLQPAENKAQTAMPTKKQAGGGKHQPAVDTAATDSITNTDRQNVGLNQASTKRDDLLPPD